MEKTSSSGRSCANGTDWAPSFLRRIVGIGAARTGKVPVHLCLSFLPIAIFAGGCGTESPKPAAQAETKPAAPAIPDDDSPIDSLHFTDLLTAGRLGRLAAVTPEGPGRGEFAELVPDHVLGHVELAKNGKQQFLAANVVPKTPTNNLPGTIITRAVVVQNNDGKWSEVLRCDEHLKNEKGFLGLTPLTSVTGWRLQYEQSDDKGLQLYFTPLKGITDSHVLPIGVRWNPKTRRYQSVDRAYEHFLAESPTMETARSRLR